MPNTLGHLGVQGATRLIDRQAGVEWIALGCLLPDLPFIAQRLAREVLPASHLLDLKAYTTVQASLAWTLLLAVAIALPTRHPRLVGATLAVQTVLHLLLDATQTKWGGGVNLLAPVDWEPWSLGWYWPESVPAVAMTLAGLVLGVRFLREARAPGTRGTPPDGKRVAAAGVCLALYLLTPLAFLGGPVAADAHGLFVLTHPDARPGAEVAFDRAGVGGGRFEAYSGETFELAGARIEDGAVSFRGRFLDERTIVVEAVHRHWPHARDLASYVGLALVGAIWIRRSPLRGGVENPVEDLEGRS